MRRLDTLPPDVIVLILRLLPVVPRLRTVSRLSKHFNALVYRSIDDLSSAVPYYVLRRLDNSLLARLPSLTNLTIHVNGQVLVLPTTLRALHIVSNAPNDVQSRFPAPLPLLTSLSLSLFGNQEGVTDIIAKVGNSLHSLSLFVNMRDGLQGPLKEYIRTANMPKLRQLWIALTNADNTELLAFFLRHAPQLETLGFIHPPCPASLISDAPLTNLQELFSVPPDMVDLSSRCPKLTALHATHLKVSIDLPLYSLWNLDLNSSLISRLNQYPNLTVIGNVELDEQNSTRLADKQLSHLINSCELLEYPSVSFLLAATNLTSLIIRYDLIPTDILLVFPRLTDLTLRPQKEHTGVFTEEVAVIRRFLHGCPRLKNITAIECSDLTGAKETLSALVSELDKIGSVRILEISAIDGEDLKSFASSLVTHWLSIKVWPYSSMV